MPEISLRLKKRKLISQLLKFIEDKEIIVIHGSRQVGKTSLLHYLIENHLKNIVFKGNLFYFDLEDFRLLELCNTSPEEVISYLKAKGADFTKRVYLLIDEIQYLDNPSSFLKLFYDRYSNKVKLIVSGSSSFLIKRKFKDSLVGRIIDFELFTLDFEEFLEFKDLKYSLRSQVPDYIHKELRRLYYEFVIYGGYPAIVLEDNIEKKEIKLKQIINTYIKKDIRDIAEIKEMNKFNDLVKVLSSQIGSLLNILELSNTLSLARKTIEEYLFILENTYIIKKLKPFHKNIRSELTKAPKVFFEDTGLANLLANKTFLDRIDGRLLENSIYSEFRKNLNPEYIYFWRTNKGQEVDFVLDYVSKNKRKRLSAIEVKNIFFNKSTTCLKYFKQTYKDAKVYFCAFEKKETPRDKYIKVVYPWELIYYLNI